MWRRVQLYGLITVMGLTMGGQPQGCEDVGKVSESFRYLMRGEGYQPPVHGEVTWYQTNGPIGGGSIQALAEDHDGRIYAGTFGDGVYTKGPQDTRWSPAEAGPADRFLMTFLTLPDNVMLAGTIRGGVFRSEDGGRRWVESGDGLTNTQVSILLHDARTNIVYAGTGAGVFKSLDGGRRWTPMNRGLEIALSRSLALDLDGTLYTGTGGSGLFTSRDQGATWRPINEGLSDDMGLRENYIRVLTMDRSGTLFAGSFGGGVFRTVDHGAHWVPMNEGLTNTSIRGLAIGDDSVMYVATGEGVFRMSSRAAKWVSISEGMGDINVQTLLLARDGTLYAGTGSGVLERPPDSTWRVSDRGMLFPAVQTVLVDEQRGLFAGTRGAGLFRSKDAGETWMRFGEGILSQNIRALARDGHGVLYAATEQGVYRADWSISRWVALEEGLAGEPVALFAPSDRLYAATSRGLFERTSETGRWVSVALGDDERPIAAIASDRGGTVYTASRDRVMRRHAHSHGWEPVSHPMVGTSIGLAGGGGMYAWTPTALFRVVEDAKGFRWKEIGAALPQGLGLASLAVDVTAGQDLLIAATDHGMWWSDGEGKEWRPAQGRLSGVPFRTVLTSDSGLLVGGSDEHGVFVGINLTSGSKRFGIF